MGEMNSGLSFEYFCLLLTPGLCWFGRRGWEYSLSFSSLKDFVLNWDDYILEIFAELCVFNCFLLEIIIGGSQLLLLLEQGFLGISLILFICPNCRLRVTGSISWDLGSLLYLYDRISGFQSWEKIVHLIKVFQRTNLRLCWSSVSYLYLMCVLVSRFPFLLIPGWIVV